MDRRNARIDRLTDEGRAIAQARTDLQMQGLTAEVKAMAIAQARTDYQGQDLTEEVKELAGQVKELVEEVQTITQAQARLEGELLILKDAILLRAVGQGVR